MKRFFKILGLNILAVWVGMSPFATLAALDGGTSVISAVTTLPFILSPVWILPVILSTTFMTLVRLESK